MAIGNTASVEIIFGQLHAARGRASFASTRSTMELAYLAVTNVNPPAANTSTVLMVAVGPMPIASIKGTTPALEQAENVYWIRYLPAITSLLFFGNASAQYVFKLAKAARSPAAVKKLVTIGSARAALDVGPYCRPHPYTRDAVGITRKKDSIPAFNRSCGSRSPRILIYRLTVMSE